jgi:hypothetical protein
VRSANAAEQPRPSAPAVIQSTNAAEQPAPLVAVGHTSQVLPGMAPLRFR